MDRHAVLAAQAFTVHDQLKRALAVLQEELMNGFGLIHDREVDLPGLARVPLSARMVVRL